MSSPLILALDVESETALDLANKIDPNDCKLKIGSKLFTSSGPSIVSSLNDLGFDIFLDLKFHDIPNTVYGAIAEACELGVWMVNIHCFGGEEMMKSARKSIVDSEATKKPLLIGVTLLTSFDDEGAKRVGIDNIKKHVNSLAKLAKESGLDGVVCSPKEVKSLKDSLGKDFIAVTPGIRSSDSKEDQKRTMSPNEALENGSDYLVIGRPIIESDNPVESIKSLLKEIH